MLTTLKTYAAEGRKVSVIFSYEEKEGAGSTLSIFGDGDAVTVDLAPEDTAALGAMLTTASYVTSPSHF
jgi:hypothetical protein